MYQQQPEVHAMAARDRYAAMLAEAAQERLVRQYYANRRTMIKQAAHRFGKSLIRLGARMIRYGKVNQTIVRV